MSTHVVLIRNHGAGSADLVDPAEVLTRGGSTFVEGDIEDAVRWARELPKDRLDDVTRVVVAGGDGSVGCGAGLAQALGVPLGVVPAGTANDFARALALDDDIEAAAQVAAFGEQLRDIDLVQVGSRWCVNLTAIGMAATAAEHAKPLKSVMGALAYPAGALRAAVQSRPISIEVDVDGDGAWSGDAWQVMLATTGAFGGFALTGGTQDGDGKLDVFVVPAGRGGKLVMDAAALTRGQLAERDGVFHARGRDVVVRMRRRRHVVIDGERVRASSRSVHAAVSGEPVRVVVA